MVKTWSLLTLGKTAIAFYLETCHGYCLIVGSINVHRKRRNVWQVHTCRTFPCSIQPVRPRVSHFSWTKVYDRPASHSLTKTLGKWSWANSNGEGFYFCLVSSTCRLSHALRFWNGIDQKKGWDGRPETSALFLLRKKSLNPLHLLLSMT